MRSDWAGRETDLDRIAAALRSGRPVALTGDEGHGKTAVVAMAIDRHRPDYPDGQLYVDLDDEEPSQALHSILLRLGVEPGQIPPNLEGRASLLQSVTRGKALLLVVDGVARVREAALFRPASTDAGYVVVTQVPLRDPDYVEHEIGPLAPDAAVAYLRRVCPNLAPDMAPRLVQEFGGRPTDLRALAGLIRQKTLGSLFEIREALDGARLFDGAYRGLGPSARWLYRLLGSLPNREFERALTAIFTGSRDWTLDGVPGPFADLLDAGLVSETRPGWYRVEHGIAGDRPARGEAVPLELFSAAYDSLAWHTRRAQLADVAVMGPGRLRYAPRLPIRIDPPAFERSAEAMAWFRTLQAALQESVRIAARHRWSDIAWALAEALWAWFANTAQDREAAACFRNALAVADGPIAIAHLSSMLGMCLLNTEDHAEAGMVLDRALTVATDALRAIEDPAEHLRCTALIGTLAEVSGRLRTKERRFAEARDLLAMSLANAEELGRPRAVGIRLRALAELERDAGAVEEAERPWLLAIARSTEAGDDRNAVGAALDLAVLRLRRGDAGGLAEVDHAVAAVADAGLWQIAAETHEDVARLLAERDPDSRDLQAEHLRRALGLYKAHGALLDADRVRRAVIGTA